VQHCRYATLRVGDRGDPVGHLDDHGVLGGVQVGEHIECQQRCRRLAPRAPHVGFQRVSEPAVGVVVRLECRQDGLNGPVVEKDGKLVPFQDAGGGFDELPGCFQVNAHAPEARQP
jgi:hypothetical protein